MFSMYFHSNQTDTSTTQGGRHIDFKKYSTHTTSNLLASHPFFIFTTHLQTIFTKIYFPGTCHLELARCFCVHMPLLQDILLEKYLNFIFFLQINVNSFKTSLKNQFFIGK
jgi:hypothetical protein